MIGCLRTCVHRQPILALYFEFENELKFYNLKAWSISYIADTWLLYLLNYTKAKQNCQICGLGVDQQVHLPRLTGHFFFVMGMDNSKTTMAD